MEVAYPEKQEFLLFRGYGGRTGKSLRKEFERGLREVDIREAGLSGYTADEDIAHGFGKRGGGVTIARKVKREEIVTHEALLWRVTKRFIMEREYIVLGKPGIVPAEDFVM